MTKVSGDFFPQPACQCANCVAARRLEAKAKRLADARRSPGGVLRLCGWAVLSAVFWGVVLVGLITGMIWLASCVPE